MIFADPPYFLSNDGITCSSGKAVSVNKGDWDKIENFEGKHAFNRRWIGLCRRTLKPNGTLWISGTLHNIYSVGWALEQERFKIINNKSSSKNIRPKSPFICWNVLFRRRRERERLFWTHFAVLRQRVSPANDWDETISALTATSNICSCLSNDSKTNAHANFSPMVCNLPIVHKRIWLLHGF